MSTFGKKAITRVQAVLIIVVVVVAAIISGAAYTSMRPSQVSTTTPQVSTASPTVNTLTIDAAYWPIDDLNQLWAEGELPFPNSLAFTIYQPLVAMNMTAEFQTGEVQYLPGLASWTVSPDGMTYTFSLKQNVKFSNGDPLNAYQVWGEMYGFYYLSGNSSAWLESYALMDMSHVNFGPATIALMTQSGLINPSQSLLNIMMNNTWPMYVTDPNTIVFHLIAPFQWFPGTLVVFCGLIFDTQYVLENGGFGTPTNYNSYFNQHPIPGTGPYVVTGLSENSYIKFAQNPTYWGANMTADEIAQQPLFDPGHAKNVIIYYKTEDVARYTDLSTGTAQISEIETADWNAVTQNPQTYSYFKAPPWSGEIAILGLNTHEYPTNLTLVRQAIVHALNYTDIAAKSLNGELFPFVGPEYPWWKDYYNLGNFQPYQYNLTLAKQLLAEANIANMPTFLLRVTTNAPAELNAAQVIQTDLAMIGINVNVVVQQPSLYYAELGTYQTNVANAAQLGQLEIDFGWGPATVTPTDYWITFVSNQSVWGNFAAYYNPVVQKAVNAFFTNSSNPAYLQSLVQSAQAQIYQDAPYAWLGTFGVWLPWGGSIVWKNGVINSFLVDPVWTGQTSEPIFNTVTFGPNQT